MLTTAHSRTSAQDARWLTEDGQPLFWSRQGRVVCEKHAPERGTDQWNREGWAWIPSFAGKNKIEYCCQECAGGPIRHHRVVLEAEVAASVPGAPAPQPAASPPSPQH